MNMTAINKRRGALLPHWTKPRGVYSVTFRLADALPRSVIEEWCRERADILRTACILHRNLSFHERVRLQELHEKLEQHMHKGYGACWMRRCDIAQVVANALNHFAEKRYRLFAWCVMPNHVHVVFQPFPGYSLSGILHSWKSFTAKRANILLGRRGEFWQEEYYDHLIRDPEDFLHCIEYVWTNPDVAGLQSWKWRWRVPPLPHNHVQDARETTAKMAVVLPRGIS